ncbi:ParB/RepB/Spo0J family partition protein [Brassicibacter mesophilus]|uniref:ParB/RepB/Spo0J family partition protein n=1 Tax=Brassicibacter mesophilus TaxID=745119 RepID=UPI003D215020
MAVKKRGLGKGLSALIPDEIVNEAKTVVDDKDKIINIDISYIEPNTEQPRREFDQEAIQELALSIKKHGIIQPIIVRKQNKGYQIVAGERRWRAAKEAGLKEIPSIIKELEQMESTEVALIENIQREDLNPIEEAIAYKNLIDRYNVTQEEISSIVGKSRSYVANIIRLLNLDEQVIKLMSNGKLSNGHGRTLLALADKEVQLKTANAIIENELSVRETERLVKGLIEDNSVEKKQKVKKRKDPSLIEFEESLRKILGTKVQIIKGKKKGKIEIEYYSDEDLDRILEVLSR